MLLMIGALGFRRVNICSVPHLGFTMPSKTKCGGGNLKTEQIPREPDDLKRELRAKGA